MKKVFLLIAALILIGGAAFFLRKDKEHSDLVVVTEQDAPISKNQHQRTESLPSHSGSTITPPANQVSDKMNKEETEKLQVELNEALSDLPTIEEVRSLPSDELHHTPQMIREGGELIGKKMESAEANAERRPETLQFLLQCSEKDDLAPAVRALCWHRLLKKIPEWKVFVPISDAKVPDDIKSLSTKLD